MKLNNFVLICGSWAILLAVVLAGVAAIAGPYVPPKTFAPGDPILSSDFNTMNSTLAASINNITGSSQITDSTITSGKLAANSVGPNALNTGAVQARHIDTGAIYSDTQFAPSWSIPTARLVSVTDTTQNWNKQVAGIFQGSGTDTRIIYNTRQMDAAAPQAASGVNIPFTVTYVEVYNISDAAGTQHIAFDGLQDSGALSSAAGGYTFFTHTAQQNLTWGPGTYATFVNTSDSNGFRITANSGNTNQSGKMYAFVARGY